MRQTYIDEAVGFYFIFGRHADGTVDVFDGTRDVFTKLPEDAANRVIEAQHEFLEKLYKILE